MITRKQRDRICAYMNVIEANVLEVGPDDEAYPNPSFGYDNLRAVQQAVQQIRLLLDFIVDDDVRNVAVVNDVLVTHP
jgi:hypothetical protein